MLLDCGKLQYPQGCSGRYRRTCMPSCAESLAIDVPRHRYNPATTDICCPPRTSGQLRNTGPGGYIAVPRFPIATIHFLKMFGRSRVACQSDRAHITATGTCTYVLISAAGSCAQRRLSTTAEAGIGSRALVAAQRRTVKSRHGCWQMAQEVTMPAICANVAIAPRYESLHLMQPLTGNGACSTGASCPAELERPG